MNHAFLRDRLSNGCRPKKKDYQLDRLIIRNFQPMEIFPDILASGDILLAILQEDAGMFSVPSKILSYFCAQRPILAAVPGQNRAARLVKDQKAGIVVSPSDHELLLRSVTYLMDHPEEARKMGENARQYAEQHFNIAAITDQFEILLGRVVDPVEAGSH